jgi:hypothetical protein
MMNPFSYSNVLIGESQNTKNRGITKDTAKMGGSGALLGKVVATLAFDRPLWTFTVIEADYYGNIDKFKVTQDGEELGIIKSSWFRNDWCVEIINHRIREKRERRGGYRTSNAEKAVMTAKKMFARKNTAEIIKEATKKIDETLSNQTWGKEREFNHAEHTLVQELMMFAKANEAVQQMFVSYMEKVNKLHLTEKVVTTKMEMLTIKGIKDAHDNKKATVILKVDGKYVVQVGDKVDMLDDNTLPENIRGKLGLLKLVEDEHGVTDVGFRVNSETFVLLTDEEKQDEQ